MRWNEGLLCHGALKSRRVVAAFWCATGCPKGDRARNPHPFRFNVPVRIESKSMAHLVVAYPKVSQADFDWIQGYRKRNDPRYSVIQPHFTIVFAVKDMEQEAFLEEVKKQAVGIKKVDFELKVATINRDDSGKHY